MVRFKSSGAITQAVGKEPSVAVVTRSYSVGAIFLLFPSLKRHTETAVDRGVIFPQ